MLGTIQKMGKVLKQFTLDHPDWGVNELAQHLAMPRSTTHDLLQSLLDIGILAQNAQGRYHISWHVMRFAQSKVWSSALVIQAHQAMATARAFFRVTSYIALLEQNEVLFLPSSVHSYVSSLDLVQLVHTGSSFASAAGKVLWADRDWDYVRAYLTQTETDFSTGPNAADRLAVYHLALQRTKSDGFALSVNEVVADWGDIAVPIYDGQSRVIAAIGYIVPSQQLLDQHHIYQQSLIEIGAKLSQIINRR